MEKKYKFKAGDKVFVTSTAFGIVPGVYIIDNVLEDNLYSDEFEYPYYIKELPVNLKEDEVREVTPLDELL